MVLYGIPNCNTVKKAKDWLATHQIAYVFHDFKKQGITAEKLQYWFDCFGWEAVINKRGLTFKKLSKEEQAEMNSAAAVKEYLLQHTSAIKRPVLEIDGKGVSIGFNAEEYTAIL